LDSGDKARYPVSGYGGMEESSQKKEAKPSTLALDKISIY
jgi:hypothetical protein